LWEEAEKRQQRLKDVKTYIKDTSKIPKEELEKGEGATLEEELKWHRYLNSAYFQAEIVDRSATTNNENRSSSSSSTSTTDRQQCQ